MLSHRGFTAWIQVEGKALPEYLVAVDSEAHRVSCWIPGTEGQVFTVYWQDEGGKIDTCAFITLDGMVVPGRFLFGEGIACRGGIRTSLNTERPFMFQKVHDESLQESPTGKASKDAGTIMLKIKRVRRIEYRSPNTIQPIPSVLGKRKAGELCVGFGLEVRAPEQQSATFKVGSHEDPEATKPSTYVTFVFRYRTPEFLEAQGIASEENASPTAPGKKRVVSGSARRVSSLPPSRPSAAEESEESSEFTDSSCEPSPTKAKKPRLGPLSLPFPAPVFPTESRRPSAELRRAASWSEMGPPQIVAEDGQSQFFLPRPARLHNMPSTLPTLDSLSVQSAQASIANSPASSESAKTEPSEEPNSSVSGSF